MSVLRFVADHLGLIFVGSTLLFAAAFVIVRLGRSPALTRGVGIASLAAAWLWLALMLLPLPRPFARAGADLGARESAGLSRSERQLSGEQRTEAANSYVADGNAVGDDAAADAAARDGAAARDNAAGESWKPAAGAERLRRHGDEPLGSIARVSGALRPGATQGDAKASSAFEQNSGPGAVQAERGEPTAGEPGAADPSTIESRMSELLAVGSHAKQRGPRVDSAHDLLEHGHEDIVVKPGVASREHRLADSDEGPALGGAAPHNGAALHKGAGARAKASAGIDWPLWLAAAYLLVAFGLIARFVWAHVLLVRLRRRCEPAPAKWREVAALPEGVRLLQSKEPVAACSFGILRPTIIVPAQLAEQPRVLKHVLLHEAAHARRKDAALKALFMLSAPLFWMQPFFWWLRARTALAAELLADQDAIAATSRRAYVADLIQLVPQARLVPLPAVATPMFRRESEFYRRMTMLLERKRPLATRCSGFARLGLAVCVLTFGLGAACFGGIQAPQGKPKAPKTPKLPNAPKPKVGLREAAPSKPSAPSPAERPAASEEPAERTFTSSLGVGHSVSVKAPKLPLPADEPSPLEKWIEQRRQGQGASKPAGAGGNAPVAPGVPGNAPVVSQGPGRGPAGAPKPGPSRRGPGAVSQPEPSPQHPGAVSRALPSHKGPSRRGPSRSGPGGVSQPAAPGAGPAPSRTGLPKAQGKRITTEDRLLLAKLAEVEVTLRFRDTPLAKVVQYLNRVQDVPVLVDPSLAEYSGKLTSLTGEKRSLRATLDSLEKLLPVRWSLGKGAVVLSRQEPMVKVDEVMPALDPRQSNDRKLLARLAKIQVDPRFVDAKLLDWVKYYQLSTGLVFVVDPALRRLPADKTALKNFSLGKRSMRDTLDVIAMILPLDWRVKNGAIRLTARTTSKRGARRGAPKRSQNPLADILEAHAAKAIAEADPETGLRTYVVKRGDSLAKIARKELGSTRRIQEIRRLNPSVGINNLRVGQRLVLPQKRSTPEKRSRARNALDVLEAGGTDPRQRSRDLLLSNLAGVTENTRDDLAAGKVPSNLDLLKLASEVLEAEADMAKAKANIGRYVPEDERNLTSKLALRAATLKREVLQEIIKGELELAKTQIKYLSRGYKSKEKNWVRIARYNTRLRVLERLLKH